MFPHKMVLVENEAVLLCVTMRNLQLHLRLHSSVQRFDIAFVIKKSGFCGGLFKRILAWQHSISKS